MIRSALALALVTALGAASLAGCGDPAYQYPHDDAEGVYFKVPNDWTVFDRTDEFFDGRIDAGTYAQPVRVWTLDASDDPAPDAPDTIDGDSPVGTAQILALAPSLGEQISVSYLRGLGFEFDPVNPPVDLQDTWEVALDQPLRTDDGLSGSVAVFNHRDSVDDPWLSQARLVFIDPTSPKGQPRAYALDIYCSAECFDAHRDEIFSVLDSWRIDL